MGRKSNERAKFCVVVVGRPHADFYTYPIKPGFSFSFIIIYTACVHPPVRRTHAGLNKKTKQNSRFQKCERAFRCVNTNKRRGFLQRKKQKHHVQHNTKQLNARFRFFDAYACAVNYDYVSGGGTVTKQGRVNRVHVRVCWPSWCSLLDASTLIVNLSICSVGLQQR